MKKDTVFKIIIIVLLALNTLQLAGFLLKPKPLHKSEFRDIAATILMLNETQKSKLYNFAETHNSKIQGLLKKQNQLLPQYFDTPNDSLLQLITKIETEKIKITKQHFSNIKSLLNKEQLLNFEKYKKEALLNILKADKPKKEPIE